MLNDFPLPHRVQFQGHAWARIVLRWLGWSFHFHGLPSAQGVVIVYPHTSNWDFLIAMLVKAAMGIKLHFWAKHTLFDFPLFGDWLSKMGGVPIDRQSPGDVVDDTAQRMQEAKSHDRLFWMGLAPEGTRSYREGWRSGFYRLTMQAQVPLGVATLDYARREVRFEHFIRLSGDVEKDYARIEAIVGKAVGFHPRQACPVRPLPTRTVKERS